jgi:MFS family permease
MDARLLTGIILASALITLDGTATAIALPSMGRDLSASVFRLQWISNAPLLVLAALLLPSGSIADRFGRIRVIRAGLVVFAAGSIGCTLARTDLMVIGARFVQGAGGALILPAVLAVLRGAYDDATARARIFGLWAAWTGAASAAGPLMAGALIDVLSWRAVFVATAFAGAAALWLVGRPAAERAGGSPTRRQPIPLVATTGLVLLFGGAAYLLMTLAGGEGNGVHLVIPAALTAGAMTLLARDGRRGLLLPRELLRSRNCLPANVSTFGLYFGLFGLSFLLALYTQQVLGYSALRAALVLLPISLMLFLAGVFGRLAARTGTRAPILIGTLVAAAGIAWLAIGAHPLTFWSHMVVGTALFGLGVSLAVSALTNAAVAAVPDACAGAASGLNHATVRAAGLVAIALLGSIAAPGAADTVSPEGFTRAMLACAVTVGAIGLLGCLWLRDEEPGGLGHTRSGGQDVR